MTSIAYFPFSPEIPWKLHQGKVIPEIDAEIWHESIDDKDLIILAYGGLLESFYSLYLAEILLKIKPNNKIYWAGNEAFYTLLSLQGIAKSKNIPNISDKYPVPLFFDKLNQTYFNCLNNYIYSKSFNDIKLKRNYRCVINQIFMNFMIENRYEIKWRNLHTHSDIISWKKQVNFHSNKPYVLIIPEATQFSQHSINCFGWTIKNIKAFSAMLRANDIDVVILSDKYSSEYFNSKMIHAPLKLPLILYLIKYAWLIMSTDVDYLLLALSLSDANLVYRKFRKNKSFRPELNANYLKSLNKIIAKRIFTPYSIFEEIKELI